MLYNEEKTSLKQDVAAFSASGKQKALWFQWSAEQAVNLIKNGPKCVLDLFETNEKQQFKALL